MNTKVTLPFGPNLWPLAQAHRHRLFGEQMALLVELVGLDDVFTVTARNGVDEIAVTAEAFHEREPEELREKAEIAEDIAVALLGGGIQTVRPTWARGRWATHAFATLGAVGILTPPDRTEGGLRLLEIQRRRARSGLPVHTHGTARRLAVPAARS